MFNKFSDIHRYSEEYLCQERHEYDVSDEDEDTPDENLDDKVRKTAANLKRAAIISCISDVEGERDTLFQGMWEQAQGIVRKPWFKEVALISAILIFKAGLFFAYREALIDNIEVGDL